MPLGNKNSFLFSQMHHTVVVVANKMFQGIDSDSLISIFSLKVVVQPPFDSVIMGITTQAIPHLFSFSAIFKNITIMSLSLLNGMKGDKIVAYRFYPSENQFMSLFLTLLMICGKVQQIQ